MLILKDSERSYFVTVLSWIFIFLEVEINNRLKVFFFFFNVHELLSTDYMPVFVRVGTGRTFTVEVERNDTISMVKQKIREQIESVTGDFRLFYGNVELEDGNTVGYYGIHIDGTLSIS